MAKKTHGIAPALFIFGAIFIGFGLWLLNQNYSDKKYDGVKSRGKVVSYKPNPEGVNSAIIEFYTKDSTLISFQDNNPSLSTRQKKELDIIYQPLNPKNAIIYDPYDIWGVPLSIAIVGIFLIIFGLVIRIIGF